ncbi:MAG: hypothetical protein WBK41_07845 [Dethiobacteria bacterium]|nr:hypothetical protein [Bacillota bacterium]
MEDKMIAQLQERIREEASENRLSCQQSFAIAREFNCQPAAVGRLCDELKVKIYGCQLGCF